MIYLDDYGKRWLKKVFARGSIRVCRLGWSKYTFFNDEPHSNEIHELVKKSRHVVFRFISQRCNFSSNLLKLLVYEGDVCIETETHTPQHVYKLRV